MKKTVFRGVWRTLAAVLLLLTLSFSTSFAATEAADGFDASGQDFSIASAEDDEVYIVEDLQSRIVKSGWYSYYMNDDGSIRRNAGFVTDNGKKYYVRKGGRIITGKAFRVGKKYYRASKTGAIMTGVYKWNNKYWYSVPKTGQWIKTEKIVKWKGKKYYVQKGGEILMDGPFIYKGKPYEADGAGHLTELEAPDGDGSPVIDVAREQVGILTGKTYWRWYYKTKFVNTDRTPWCGAFVAWCYNAAGMYDKVTVAKKYGPLGYVPSYSRYADKYKKWVRRTKAKGGDIIIFGRNMHVGLVEGLCKGSDGEYDYIITIEGNAGPTAALGCGKPGAVVRNIYSIDSSKIKGIIRP